jgi:hypothetical protein
MACLFGWEPFIGEFQGEPFSGEFRTFSRDFQGILSRGFSQGGYLDFYRIIHKVEF